MQWLNHWLKGADNGVDQAPLPVAAEVTGYPHVSLWASSSTDDGDMVFSLNDVAPDGTSRQVIQGCLNVPRQALLSAPKPLVPGEAKIDVDLPPTACVFQPGHRLRLALAGAAPGLPFPQGPGPNPAAFTGTLMQDAGHRRPWRCRSSAPPGSSSRG